MGLGKDERAGQAWRYWGPGDWILPVPLPYLVLPYNNTCALRQEPAACETRRLVEDEITVARGSAVGFAAPEPF